MAGLLDLIAARTPEESRQTLADLVRGPQNRLRNLMPVGLLDAAKQYINDASPGGLLNREWTPERVSQVSSTAQDFVPVWGGIKGAREEWDAGNPGWAAFNAATVPVDLATLGGGTALKALAHGLPLVGGMFVGKGAKTWDAVMASKAMELEKAGADPRAIWKETGNWKGTDGHWRQEIPDNAAGWNMNQGQYFSRNDAIKIKDNAHGNYAESSIKSIYSQVSSVLLIL